LYISSRLKNKYILIYSPNAFILPINPKSTGGTSRPLTGKSSSLPLSRRGSDQNLKNCIYKIGNKTRKKDPGKPSVRFQEIKND